MSAPLPCTWDGEAFLPLWRYKKHCDKQFVVGITYPLVVQEERSQATHRHYFASVNEAWKNLPEDLAEQFATADHLRKRALIDAGYFDEEIIDVDTNEAALRVAASLRRRDDFALVVVRGPLVVIRTAKSQSTRAMDRKTFQKSKEDVLGVLSNLIGTDPESLKANAERAA